MKLMDKLRDKAKRRLGRFSRDENGLASAEMALVLPIYLFAILGTFTYWDAFDVGNRAQKAAFTVSDLITRKQDVVTEGYVNGLFSTMQYMMGPEIPVRSRITSVFYNGTLRRYEVIWSRSSTPGIPQLTTATILTLQSHLPELADGDSIMVVEGNFDYEPILGEWTSLGTGMGSTDEATVEAGVMRQVVVTRPRFLPKICMQGVACG